MNENNLESHPDLARGTGLPPARAFWKALAIVPIVGIVWSAIFVLGVFFSEIRTSEWPEFATFGLVAAPLLLLVFYYRYRKGISYASNRADYGIHIVGLAIAISMAVSLHRRLPLVGAVMYLFFLIRSLLRKKEPRVSTNE